MLCMENETPPDQSRITVSHSHPKPQLLFKSLFTLLERSLFETERFWSPRHCRNKSRGVRGQRATGRRYRPCFWKVLSLGMLAFVQSICASVRQTQCMPRAGIDKHQRSCTTPLSHPSLT